MGEILKCKVRTRLPSDVSEGHLCQSDEAQLNCFRLSGSGGFTHVQ